MWVLGKKGDEIKCGCGKRGGACIVQVRRENQNTEGCVLVTITGLVGFSVLIHLQVSYAI